MKKSRKNPEPEQLIATTPLQSFLLTECGLPASTADMRWNRSVTMNGKQMLEPLNPSDYPIPYEYKSTPDYVPAWSLGKLIEIVGAVPNTSDPRFMIDLLVNNICEQLRNGGGMLHNLNLRTE